MFVCEICGAVVRGKSACYLERRDKKTKIVKTLKVCRECKYGRSK